MASTALNAEAAKEAALQAGIVWQYYGEQSTSWFHHLAKAPIAPALQSRTEIKALRDWWYPRQPSHQAELLEALDNLLAPEAAAAAEGISSNGCSTITELEAALSSFHAAKHQAWMAYLTSSTSASGPLSARLGPVLNQVLDPTQTCFLPKRCVWDNVLAHMEEISYMQDTEQPGVIVFHGNETRLDRVWIEQCMAAVGSGAGAQRWVHILHTAHHRACSLQRLAYTRLPGVYVVGKTQFVTNGFACYTPAPIMHQHADDTSIYAQSPSDAQVILHTTVDLHCAATLSELQRRKSQGLGLGSFSYLSDPDAATGVTFVAQDASVKHLGIPLSRQPQVAATAFYAAILRKVELKIARWFVLSGTSTRLYPGKYTCFHAVKDGGIALVDPRAQILALQAKFASRLLEPEQQRSRQTI
ncbi:g6736 [Coccomyxa elongata]